MSLEPSQIAFAVKAVRALAAERSKGSTAPLCSELNILLLAAHDVIVDRMFEAVRENKYDTQNTLRDCARLIRSVAKLVGWPSLSPEDFIDQLTKSLNPDI